MADNADHSGAMLQGPRRDHKTTRRPARAAGPIYIALRDDIIHMRLRPRAVLSEKLLSQRFGVSRTPVREALLRLSDDGLVDIFPQSGTFVARIPRRALYEAIVIRKSLEATTVSLAMRHCSAIALDRLDRNQADLIKAARQKDIYACHIIDCAFHRTLAEIAGFPGIWAVIEQVKTQIDRYRHITLPQAGRLDIVIAEHGAIVAAIRRRDEAAAVAAMGAHIGRMSEELDSMEQLDPDLFSSENE